MLNETYQPFDRKHLAYGGKYYPMDMQFEIRGAGVAEIRRWSNIDENDQTSISTSVIDMISSCVKVTSTAGNKYSYKDIYEHDKIPFLLAIIQVSFADDRHLYVKGSCTGEGCGKEFEKLRINPANLMFPDIAEKYDEFFDADSGMFRLQTKNDGEIDYKMSTIGIGQVMFQWISTFTPQYIRTHQQDFKLIQSIVTSHQGLSAEKLRRIQIEQFNQWDERRLAIQNILVRDLNSEILPTLKYVCPVCGATFLTRLAIIGGYREMFMPVESADDFLVRKSGVSDEKHVLDSESH